MPYTIYYSAGYWENLEHLGQAKKNEDGTVSFNLMCPDRTSQQFTSIGTVGFFVKAIFLDKEKYLSTYADALIAKEIC